MKRFLVDEKKIRNIIRKRVLEESNIEKNEEKKPRCVPENIIPLDEMVGKAEEYSRYSPGITKRISGVNSMVDTLGILNNLRLFKDVKDGGAHLA